MLSPRSTQKTSKYFCLICLSTIFRRFLKRGHIFVKDAEFVPDGGFCRQLMGCRRMGILLLRKTRKADQLGNQGLPSPHSTKSRPPWVSIIISKHTKQISLQKEDNSGAKSEELKERRKGRTEGGREGIVGRKRGHVDQNTLLSLFALGLSLPY